MPATLLGSVRRGQAWARALPLDLAAALGGGATDDVVPLVQHPLQLGDGLGRVGGDAGGELERCLLGAGSGSDAVDEAQPQRLVSADRPRAQEQVLGGGEAAEGDEP